MTAKDLLESERRWCAIIASALPYSAPEVERALAFFDGNQDQAIALCTVCTRAHANLDEVMAILRDLHTKYLLLQSL